VLIAGPNLTLDRTGSIAELRPGDVLRFERVVVTPGGKGLNVARTARALGARALLVGFVPGETGRVGAAMIEREGVALRGVPCGGELRSTAIVIEEGGRTTVLNEPGPRIDRADWEALEAAITRSLPEKGSDPSRVATTLKGSDPFRGGHGVLVCSGSVPPGSPDDAYARLAALAAAAGVPCVVDAAGVTLARALAARPAVVCPNLAEAEAVLGDGAGSQPVLTAADARPRALAAAAELIARGARGALVTADAAGAALATAKGPAHWLPAPRIAEVRNPVGAGDVLASALAAALERGEPLLESARRGVAAAAASVESATAGELEPARAAELLPAVVAERA